MRTLFDEPEEPKVIEPKVIEPKISYRLFDERRLRFVPKMMSDLTGKEAAARNAYFEKSKCAHLQWKNNEEKPGRVYTIKR